VNTMEGVSIEALHKGFLGSSQNLFQNVERRKSVGDMGVELCAWLRPEVGVVIGASLAVAAPRPRGR
jgi:hypothetical protein